MTTALGQGRIDTEVVDADILDFPRGTCMLATTQFHVVPPASLNSARIPSTTGDLVRMFPDFKRDLDFDVEIKAVSVLIGVQKDTVHLHRVIESHVSSDGRLLLQRTPLGCAITGVSEDPSSHTRHVNLIQTLQDDESSNEKVSAPLQLEDRPSSYNDNKACDTGQRPQSSPAFAGSSLPARRLTVDAALRAAPLSCTPTFTSRCYEHSRISLHSLKPHQSLIATEAVATTHRRSFSN